MENDHRVIVPANNLSSLSWKIRLFYGVGHVLNDICASMWFTYLLVFFHFVLGFDTVNSGGILFIGQIADALSTPFIENMTRCGLPLVAESFALSDGYQSDKDDGFWLCKHGKRKTWHIVGTLCIICSFPFIFAPCVGCGNADVSSQMVYYGAFVVIFQFGWAAVQISHLALIPELTSCEHERTRLTAIRYSFTVISTILIYIVTWISLKAGEDIDPGNQIGPNDAINFQRVVYVGLAIGTLASIVFQFGVKEEGRSSRISATENRHKSACEYLMDITFYGVAIIYMSTRMFVNLAQVYIPLYLHETLSKEAETLAVIPLLMYISSFAGSVGVHHLNKLFGRTATYLFGAVLGIGTCIWIELGSGKLYAEYEIYAVAVLLGISGSFLLVTSLGITVDLIGTNTDTGAFVYGSMSFADKLGNGVSVMLIQYMKSPSSRYYYRNILSYVCGGAAIAGAVTLIVIRMTSEKFTRSPEETPLLSQEIEDR